jgi:hypothetical protein
MQVPGRFVIRHEIMSGIRIVPVDGTSSKTFACCMRPRGRWEGDTPSSTRRTFRPNALPRSAGDGAAGH